MPTFLKREYARPIASIGPTEKVVGMLASVICVLIVAVFLWQAASEDAGVPETGVLQHAPPAGEIKVAARETYGAARKASLPNIEGWGEPQRVSQFLAGEMYRKIDGQAPAYIDAGVERLTFASYERSDRPGEVIDVYCYQVDSEAHASALFQSESPPGAVALPVGTDGYEVGGAVFFRIGRDYVQIVPGGTAEVDAVAARAIADRVAAWLADR